MHPSVQTTNCYALDISMKPLLQKLVVLAAEFPVHQGAQLSGVLLNYFQHFVVE